MDSISRIFGRLNIQQLCSFLLFGQERMHLYPSDYQAELNHVVSDVYKMIDDHFETLDEHDAVSNLITELILTFEEIYFETGLKCGAALTLELLEGRPKSDCG